MAKFKLAGSKKKKIDSKRGLIPCGLLVAAVFALMFWLFYLVLRSGSGS